MSELEPCPFCGGNAEYNEEMTRGIEKVIGCEDCGAGAFYSDWNTRPIEDELRRQLEIAREQLEIARYKLCEYNCLMTIAAMDALAKKGE